MDGISLVILYAPVPSRLAGQHDLTLLEALQTDPLYADLNEKINAKEEMKEKMENRNTALQVTMATGIPQWKCGE